MRTGLTVAVIALVVVATTLFGSLVSSLRRTLIASGNERNLIVLRKGATNDGSSVLPLEAFQALRFFEGVARDAAGNPLASPELVVQPFFRTMDGGRENVLVRGVEPVALQVHDEVAIVEGRMFQPASDEAIVGSGVAGRYVGAKVGDTLAFGRGEWKVVGRFDSDGSSFESEVWVDVRELAADAKRTIPYSGLRVRAAEGADMDALARRIDADPRYRAGGDTRAGLLREAGRVRQRALLHRGRARAARRHRRRLRGHQHALRRRAVASRRDRNAARARLLARGDRALVPDRVAGDRVRRFCDRRCARGRARSTRLVLARWHRASAPPPSRPT